MGSMGSCFSSASIVSSQLLQYQTGNGIPNAICLEMHQSHFRPLTQFSYLFLIWSGCHLISLPHFSNFSFRSRYLMHHCFFSMNSISVLHLSHTFTGWVIFFCDFSAPAFFRSWITCSLASFIFSPLYFPASPVIVPSGAMAILMGSLCSLCHSISVWSPKVQHITTPVPFSGSALGSGRMGTSMSNKGVFAFFPFSGLNLLSSGW